ncbi:MAG: PilZ domain-containing protein [Desulfobacterales bacterium]|nr:PilZ domain-containing protein [Desulfobacterales bacterium]
MNASREMINRRKHKRFQVDDGFFAVIGGGCPRLGQIKNISEGGLVFEYLRTDNESEDFCRMNILFNDRKSMIKDIPFRIVFEETVNGASCFGSVSMRRLTVAFGELTPGQRSCLEPLLQDRKAVSDRRKSTRRNHKFLMNVQDRVTGVFHDAAAYNYCDDGLHFGADAPLAPGAAVSIALEDPLYPDEPFFPMATVRWAKGNQGRRAEYAFEFGVEYDEPVYLAYSGSREKQFSRGWLTGMIHGDDSRG